MENFLFTLNSVSATWLSPSSTSWEVDITLAFLGGLRHFLLLPPCTQKDPSLPPPGKLRNMRKHQVETRSSRSRKSGALQGKALPFCWSPGACRDGLGEPNDDRGLISRQQSPLAEISDPPAEVCKPAPAKAHQPCRENVEDTAPVTLSPLAALAPLAERPLHVATLSPGPTTSLVTFGLHSPLSASQAPEPLLPLNKFSTWPLVLASPPSQPPDPVASHLPPPVYCLAISQGHWMALLLGSIPQSLCQNNSSWLTFSIPVILSLGYRSCPISARSWWELTAKDLCFLTLSHGQSQQEYFSLRLPEASFWGDPTHRQTEPGGPTLINSNIDKLLVIIITKRKELNTWKEKEKKKSDSSLDSLGNTFKSLGHEQDDRTPQLFWSMKDKPEQLPSPQQLSGPKELQGHLQYKSSQLVWGLFFLHSDSLAATVRVSGSPLEFPSLLFNELFHSFLIQIQSQPSPQTFQPQLWSLPVAQPQPLARALPLSQPSPLADTHSQPHTSSYLPIPPCYSPQIVAQGAPCPTNQQKAQLLIPTSIQCLECHLLGKEQESQRDLPCVVKKPREACSQLTPNSEAFQDHESVYLLPGDFFIPELQEQLEEHLQQSFTQHCCGLSPRPHVSPDLIQRQDLQQTFTPHCCGLSPRPHLSPDLIQRQDLQHRFTQQCCRLSARPHISPDLIQPRDEFPGISQVKDRHGSSVFIGGSSQNMQKMEFKGPAKFQLGKIPSNDPKHSLWRVLEDLPRALESNSRKVPGANTEKKSERDWMRLLGSDSGKDSPRSPEMKHLEDIVEVHWHRKLGEINEGMFPEGVHHPSLTNGHLSSLENSNIHMESRNLAPSEGEESHVNTSQQLSFLDVHTRQVLEAHIKRFQESHERRQTLKVHKPPHLLKVQKAQPLSLPQPAFLSSATSESGAKSTAEAANVPGEPPHKDPGDKVAAKTSVSTQRSPHPGPLPVCKEAQRSAYKTETPSGDNILSTQASLSSFQSMSSSDTSDSQGACDFLSRGQSSQGQEEPRSPKFQNLWKSLSKMFGRIGKREGRRRPTQGRHEQTLTELSPASQDTESVESLSSQSSLLLPEKGQASPESHFKKRIRRFLHWTFPNKKSKGHKDPLQKVKPTPAATWSQGPVPSGLSVDNGKAEAQALMTTVGQILEEKMGLHHELSASTAPVGGCSSHHRGPSYTRAKSSDERYGLESPCHPSGSQPSSQAQVDQRWGQQLGLTSQGACVTSLSLPAQATAREILGPLHSLP